MKMNTGFCYLGFVALLCATLDAWSATNVVVYNNYSFSPNPVTNNVGDTVQWVYGGGVGHTVDSSVEEFCGPVGTTGCFKTFMTPGNYPYYCSPHLAFGMTGLVVVVAAPTPATPALLTNMTVLSNGLAQFQVMSTADRTNLVQATTNIAMTNWTTISTVVPATNSFVVTDSNAPSFQLRFYRVVQP